MKAKLIFVGRMDNSDGSFEQANRVYSPNGIAPCIVCNNSHQSKVLCDVKAFDKPKVVGGIGKKGTTNKYHQQNRIYDGNRIAISITTSFMPWYLL